MGSIYLVGTSHLDLKGPGRLEKLLNLVKPRFIAIESNEEEARKRVEDHYKILRELKENESALRRVAGEDGANKISEYLSMMGYEIWVPENFARRNPRTELLYLDNLPEEQIAGMRKELFGDRMNDSGEMSGNFIEDIQRLDFESYQREVDASYDDNSVEEWRTRDPENFERVMIDREKQIEQRIREVFRKSDQDLVYIGGALHFFGEYYNLSDRLRDLNPVRIKLKEVDQFTY